MSNLANRLAVLTPQESDAALSAIWKRFASTEEYEALVLLITGLLAAGENPLLTPATPDSERAFYAGYAAGLRRLILSINKAVSFNPSSAEYEPFEVVSDDSPAPADAGQII